MVCRPAGDERPDADGAALSLVVGAGGELRRRAARRRVLRCAQRHAQPRRARERCRAERVRGPGGTASGAHLEGARESGTGADADDAAAARVAAGTGRRDAVPGTDSRQDLRARARQLRVAPRHRRRGAEDAACAGAGVGAGARDGGDAARSGALLVRARRQGRHAVPGRQDYLRQNDRDPEQGDQPRHDRSLREGEGVSASGQLQRQELALAPGPSPHLTPLYRHSTKALLATRWAGIAAASAHTVINSIATPTSVAGSDRSSPAIEARAKPAAIGHDATPINTPAVATRIASPTTIRTILGRDAPSAIRIRISRPRAAVRYAVTP